MIQRIRDRWPFKSQKGQDRWVILKVLPFLRGGFFVDLAAADGVEHSNTYALEKLFGWRGICIEPNPRLFEKLKRTRNCFLDSSVADCVSGTVQFRIDNGQLGGIVADDTDNSVRARGDELATAEIIALQAKPLEAILDAHRAPAEIDYLSLDVEGSEERVLRQFPFGRYTFRCVTIERPSVAVNELMFTAGYVFVKNVTFDTFYVHQSIAGSRRIDAKPFEQVPPKNF